MFNQNQQMFSLIGGGPPKTQRLIRRPLPSTIIPESTNLEETVHDQTNSLNKSSTSSASNSTKSLLDILNFDSDVKFPEISVISSDIDALTVIPLSINTDNRSNSEYECEYELSIVKNTSNSESKPPSKPQHQTPNVAPKKAYEEDKYPILVDDNSSKSVELVVNFNPLLNMTFVPNSLYANKPNTKISYTNSKSTKKDTNKGSITTIPEINIQITINETEIQPTENKSKNIKLDSKVNDQSQKIKPETDSSSSSTLSKSSYSSLSPSPAKRTVSDGILETRKEAMSPILNKIFDLLDNSQHFSNQSNSSNSLNNTKLQRTNSIEEEDADENKCISAYEQIVRLLDQSLDDRMKEISDHSIVYDFYGDEYDAMEGSKSSYHEINEINNTQSEHDYYFKPNSNNYWLDTEPRKVKTVYDEIAHLLDNAHLLKIQRQKLFTNAYF
jgi:hypothetical protein